jgi:V/A-type H+-transporting ATPase subunit E
MSPARNDIQALVSAIREEVTGEAGQILADARTQAESIRRQAQTQADAEREAILQRARQEAEALREHTAAAAHLEAQTLKLKRREQLLERAFAEARQQLASAPQWPDYEQIAHRLVREAVERLGAAEVVARVDEETRRVLSDDALAELGEELDVHLRDGEPLTRSGGAVVETLDGHRRYDNTLETRLARMRESLRTPVYHILMGETA